MGWQVRPGPGRTGRGSDKVADSALVPLPEMTLVKLDMSGSVREPIEVYLTPEERAQLDRAAQELGVSRSEVLRRGIVEVRSPRYEGPLRDLVEDDFVTPALSQPGPPPPSAPLTSLGALMGELDADRRER